MRHTDTQGTEIQCSNMVSTRGEVQKMHTWGQEGAILILSETFLS